MKISLVGYGKSNRSLLRKLCGKHEIFVSETRKLSREEKMEISKCGEYEESHTERILNSELIVMSPGISPLSRVGSMVLDSKVRHTSDIVAFLELTRPRFGKIVGITGTNGKTTATSMLNHFLRKIGYSTCLCGNNEKPISELEGYVDFLVLELSSFQLFWSDRLEIDYGLILNIAPDHIDWHGSFENYKRAKLKMVKFSKVLVTPKDIGIGFTYEKLDLELPDRLKNAQNVENVSALSKLIELMGFSVEDFLESLADFELPGHRMEFVAEIDGVRFFDDSKATNTHAVIKALENFEKVTLILSGILKEEDLEDFSKVVSEKAEAVVILGEEMRKKLPEIGVPTFFASDMDEAVRKAFQVSSGIVLLSPAGASFDLYSGYAERGEDFKRAVLELMRSGS